jgi:Rrf2 family protein
VKFSTRARYALRMMLAVARSSEGGGPVSMTVISRDTGISKSYLEQLAIPLRSAGLLHGRAGRSGGYTLAKPSSEIRAREVIEAAIGPIDLVECVGDPDLCVRAEECRTRLLWATVTSRVRSALEEFSLADLNDAGFVQDMRQSLGTDLVMPRRAGSKAVRPVCEPSKSRGLKKKSPSRL